MNRPATRSTLLLALSFALAAPVVVAFLGNREVEASMPGVLEAPLRAPIAAARPQPIRLPERVPASDRAVIASLPMDSSLAGPWRSLADTLKRRVLGPAEWEAQVASCADEWGATDRAVLQAAAVDERIASHERLAALELLRALGAAASVQPTIEQEQELFDAAFGPQAFGTTCWASASALGAFASQSGRAKLLDELDAADPSRSCVALHGVRVGARACLLREITARLAQSHDSAQRNRLSVAAQSVARPRERLADEPVFLPAGELLQMAQDRELTGYARRNLLLAVASLGVPETELELCDLACDPKNVESRLASEIANALRASPCARLPEELEFRLRSNTLDARVRERLLATCDALKKREALALNPSAALR